MVATVQTTSLDGTTAKQQHTFTLQVQPFFAAIVAPIFLLLLVVIAAFGGGWFGLHTLYHRQRPPSELNSSPRPPVLNP
jgi:hypothetical protein